MAQPSQHPSIGHSILAALEETCVSKSIMFFLNLVIFFMGIIITVCSIIVIAQAGKLDKEFSLIFEDNPEIMTGLYIVLGTGIVLTFVGFCGCCGSLCEQDEVMLVLFLTLVVCVFITQILAFLLAFLKMPKAEAVIRKSMGFVETHWIPLDSTPVEVKEYLEYLDHHVANQTEEQFTLAWVKLQNHFKCCGYDSPGDWEEVINAPAYAAYCTENALEDLTASNTATREISREQNFMNRIEDQSKEDTFPYGCRKTVFGKYGMIMMISSIIVLVVEFFIIVMSCFLVHKAIKKHKAKRAKINTQSVEEDEE